MLLVAALLTPIATPALAGPVITEPTSLSPGQQYRLAFVTSTTRNAVTADISGYNSFVDALGDSVIASDWKAIASTSAIDARDNTGTLPSTAGGALGVPIFLLSDTLVAISNDDLWNGPIPTTFSITETGHPSGAVTPWTGTASDGTEDVGLGLGSFPNATLGSTSSVTLTWVDATTEATPTEHPFYALSDVLTIPPAVPALPALSWAGQLLLLVLLVLLGVSWVVMTAHRRRSA